jgi:hypothetical protein
MSDDYLIWYYKKQKRIHRNGPKHKVRKVVGHIRDMREAVIDLQIDGNEVTAVLRNGILIERK